MLLPIIYFSFIIVNALVFLSGKSSKWVYIPSSIFLIIFASGKRTADCFLTHDVWNYQYSYEHLDDYITFEIGYKYIERLCYNNGISFDYFYAILVSTIIILMLIAIKRIGGNLHLTLFCWFFYFIIITECHLRNQSALAIMMLTIFPFYTTKLKSKKWVFSFLFLSMLFHVSFIVFVIPLALSFYKDENLKVRKYGIVASILLFILLLATSAGKVVNSFVMMFSFMGELPTKYVGYEQSHTGLSSIFLISIYLFTIWHIAKIRERNKIFKGKSKQYVYENIDMYYRFLIYSCFLLPLLLVNTAFYRIFRDLSFIAIAYMGIHTTLKLTPLVSRLETFLAAVTISGGWFYFDIIIKGYWPEYSRYFFDVNLLWEI